MVATISVRSKSRRSALMRMIVAGPLSDASEVDEEEELKKVINGITPRAFEKFFAEYKAKKEKEDLGWATVVEPIPMVCIGNV